MSDQKTEKFLNEGREISLFFGCSKAGKTSFLLEKKFIAISIIALIAIATFFVIANGNSNFPAVESYNGDITLYKSLSCGCCGLYSEYFNSKGREIEIITRDDITDIKDEYNIPEELRSCHTTIVGDYFVEGHVPLEAVNKLIEEQPDISGLAMSGMPMGSPGMPGGKVGDFIIYAVDKDGNSEEFMRI